MGSAISQEEIKTNPFRLCEDENYYYFVHGSALSEYEDFNRIDPTRGSGDDLGGGFYTFKLCEDNHDQAMAKARQRAEKQALPRNPNRFGQSSRTPKNKKKPHLVFTRIPISTYENLSVLTLGTLGEQAVYRNNDRWRKLGSDVSVGFMLYGQGSKCMYKEPKQYKFEGNGIECLELLGKEELQ